VRRSLLARPVLTLTSILTVALSVGLALTLFEARDAGEQAMLRGGGNTHLVVSRDGSPLAAVLNNVYFSETPRRPLRWAEFRTIAERYPLEYAIPTLLGDSYRGQPVVATTREMFEVFTPSPGPDSSWTFAAGRPFDDHWEIVVGAEAARRTGLGLGDHVHLSHGYGESDHAAHDDRHFDVVGVLAPTGTPMDRALFISLESSWTMHADDRRRAEDPGAPLLAVEDLTDADRMVTGIHLRVATRPGRMMTTMMQQVFDELRRDTTITVAQPGVQIRRLLEVVSGVDHLVSGLLLVVLLSSALSIALALVNATEHRRRQIAVLRVLGFTRARLVRLTLTESAMIGLIGGTLGILLAMAGVHLVAFLL
ncbi:MAG: ABC transporter permease, partial [Phycisphaerales bacterium]|nr:ABC transporter permease [Phycisphaerales bacterium]